MHGTHLLLVVAGLVALTVSSAACSRPVIPDDAFDMRTEPAARALRDRDRAAFNDLVKHMEASTAAGESPDLARLRYHAYLRTHVVPRYIALADDDAIHDYTRVTLAELEELRERSYYRCFSFLFGDRMNETERLRLESTFSDATREAGRLATSRLIESSESTPVSIDEVAAWRVLDNAVIPRLPAWLGERTMVLRDSASRDIDRVAACEVTLEVYKGAVDLPTPDGPLLRRYLLAGLMMSGL